MMKWTGFLLGMCLLSSLWMFQPTTQTTTSHVQVAKQQATHQSTLKRAYTTFVVVTTAGVSYLMDWSFLSLMFVFFGSFAYFLFRPAKDQTPLFSPLPDHIEHI
ncbi:MAG: hypothetical protein CL920_28750 [Deltaproteobacteria bacterium]|nr:hypothetical protein [Deltaproteobacteria bacterium]MBU52706.1 hypothetical protein [Deltaproteobacteria bacterium]